MGAIRARFFLFSQYLQVCVTFGYGFSFLKCMSSDLFLEFLKFDELGQDPRKIRYEPWFSGYSLAGRGIRDFTLLILVRNQIIFILHSLTKIWECAVRKWNIFIYCVSNAISVAKTVLLYAYSLTCLHVHCLVVCTAFNVGCCCVESITRVSMNV